MANRNAGGNRSKSRAQHELDGTYRKDRHEALNNPEPPASRPDPSSELDELEQDLWDRLMVDLESQQGVLYAVDRAVAYHYVKLYAETERIAAQQESARASLARLEENIGDVEAADKAYLFGQIAKLHQLVSKCTDQLRQGRMAIRQYLVEFGLTPASRGRVKLPAKKAEVDPLAAMQAARPAMALVKS